MNGIKKTENSIFLDSFWIRCSLNLPPTPGSRSPLDRFHLLLLRPTTAFAFSIGQFSGFHDILHFRNLLGIMGRPLPSVPHSEYQVDRRRQQQHHQDSSRDLEEDEHASGFFELNHWLHGRERGTPTDLYLQFWEGCRNDDLPGVHRLVRRRSSEEFPLVGRFGISEALLFDSWYMMLTTFC